MKARIDVLSILCEWFEKGGGAQDALADNELYNSMKGFLEVSAKIPSNLSTEERIPWMEVENARHNTLSLFTVQTCRPKLQYPLNINSTDTANSQNYGQQLSSIDDLDPEALVDNLDALAAATMRAVTADVSLCTVSLLHYKLTLTQGYLCYHRLTGGPISRSNRMVPPPRAFIRFGRS